MTGRRPVHGLRAPAGVIWTVCEQPALGRRRCRRLYFPVLAAARSRRWPRRPAHVQKFHPHHVSVIGLAKKTLPRDRVERTSKFHTFSVHTEKTLLWMPVGAVLTVFLHRRLPVPGVNRQLRSFVFMDYHYAAGVDSRGGGSDNHMTSTCGVRAEPVCWRSLW